MHNEYWLEKWENADIGFNQSLINPWLQRYFPLLNKMKGTHFFVPLCGKSIDMAWIKQQGMKLIGVELSPLACRDFFLEQRIHYSSENKEDFTVYQGEDIILYCGNFFALQAKHLPRIDIVYDRAALIALPPDLRLAYARHLTGIASGATIFLISLNYNQHEMAGPPFAVDQDEIEHLFSENYEISLLRSEKINTISEHLRHKGLQQAYEEIYILKWNRVC